jgi:hypothetical protein
LVGRPEAAGLRLAGYQARLRREPGTGAVQPVWRSGCRVGRDRAPEMALRKPGE